MPIVGRLRVRRCQKPKAILCHSARGFTTAQPRFVKVYFCDPHSPWQRGSNEYTKGLLEWTLKVGHLNGRSYQNLPYSHVMRIINLLVYIM